MVQINLFISVEALQTKITKICISVPIKPRYKIFLSTSLLFWNDRNSRFWWHDNLCFCLESHLNLNQNEYLKIWFAFVSVIPVDSKLSFHYNSIIPHIHLTFFVNLGELKLFYHSMYSYVNLLKSSSLHSSKRSFKIRNWLNRCLKNR